MKSTDATHQAVSEEELACEPGFGEFPAAHETANARQDILDGRRCKWCGRDKNVQPEPEELRAAGRGPKGCEGTHICDACAAVLIERRKDEMLKELVGGADKEDLRAMRTIINLRIKRIERREEAARARNR